MKNKTCTERKTVEEKPLLFTGEMVRAILDGRKTQTRRIVKFQEFGCFTGDCPHQKQSECDLAILKECPKGKPGDRLWVKETHWRYGFWRKNGLSPKGRQKWRFQALPHELGVRFSAPGPTPKRGRKGWHKRPSIFMPRKASRITLEYFSSMREKCEP